MSILAVEKKHGKPLLCNNINGISIANFKIPMMPYHGLLNVLHTILTRCRDWLLSYLSDFALSPHAPPICDHQDQEYKETRLHSYFAASVVYLDAQPSAGIQRNFLAQYSMQCVYSLHAH